MIDYNNWKKEQKKIPKPSKTFHCYWIEVDNLHPHPEPTKESGKMLFFYSIDKIDFNWGKIRLGTICGELGYKSKVSTAQTKHKSKVICIYFYDFNDKKDIKRIKKCLRKDLKIKQKPKIKLNKVTLEEMKKRVFSRKINFKFVTFPERISKILYSLQRDTLE